MAFVFVFCVHVTPRILRAVGLLFVCVCWSTYPRLVRCTCHRKFVSWRIRLHSIPIYIR